jgi:Fe-S-cluster formation regulator IscX/YfhJ
MNKSKDIKPLTKIKNRSDIKSFKVVDEYEDDHQQCAECIINGIKIEFMWYDELGCLYYWKDSEKAFKDLKANIKNEVYLAKNYELDYPEDA